MRRLLALLFALPCAILLGADEPKQPDTPKGTTFTFTFAKSKVFPGTTRNVTVTAACGSRRGRGCRCATRRAA